MLIKLRNESTSSNWTCAFVASSSRITKASDWLCERIFSYLDELLLEHLDECNELIIKYRGVRLGTENLMMAVFHMDEHESGLCHMHLAILPITEQGKLSNKTLITRDFITSIHKLMPIILRNHGFNIDDKAESERKNREKAYEVMYQQERSR